MKSICLILSFLVLQVWGQAPTSDPNLSTPPPPKPDVVDSNQSGSTEPVPIGRPSSGGTETFATPDSTSAPTPENESPSSSEASSPEDITNGDAGDVTGGEAESPETSKAPVADDDSVAPPQVSEPQTAAGTQDSQADTDEKGNDIVSSDASLLETLPTWNCLVDTPPADKGAFTVGEKFLLICSGEAANFSGGKIHFQMPEPLLYAIKIISVDQVKPNELIVTAASYYKGKHDLKGLVIVEDMEEKFKVAPLILSVRTVIEDPKQKPYGPQSAIKLSYPMWMWIASIGLVFLFLGFGLFRMHRRAQKLRVLEGLKMHNSALGAYNQLNKDLRSLNRVYVFSKHREWTNEHSQKYMSELDDFFRLYLLREFIVPATEWKSGLVLSEIQKLDRKRYPSYGVMLRKYLKELDRALKSIDKVQMEDCQQLTQLARRVSQKVWQARGRS